MEGKKEKKSRKIRFDTRPNGGNLRVLYVLKKKTLEFEPDSLHFRTVSEVETGDFEALLWMDIK